MRTLSFTWLIGGAVLLIQVALVTLFQSALLTPLPIRYNLWGQVIAWQATNPLATAYLTSLVMPLLWFAMTALPSGPAAPTRFFWFSSRNIILISLASWDVFLMSNLFFNLPWWHLAQFIISSAFWALFGVRLAYEVYRRLQA
ncbi:hypothetical protein [Lactiplantibacillus daowaiensis]|uniref:Integral membrane protein n=1 Tax=Lactiplantibacillus daowaiensis TaxID=2559918 RepID=A0ABW1S2L8_9LACO